MTYLTPDTEFDAIAPLWSPAESPDPRRDMAERLPQAIQPFLTWLTAKPAPDEPVREKPGTRFVAIALLQIVCGVALTAWAAAAAPVAMACILVPLGLLLTTSGLGLVQVVVFHHCSHGTVFANAHTNAAVGRLVSALLLFKHFDAYKREHMLHHSHNKLLTDEDEFADFVFGTCGLVAGVSRRALWRRVILSLFSPLFHAQFAYRRARAALLTADRAHNRAGLGFWAFVIGAGLASGHAGLVLLAWVFPVTVLLQIATVFRILCEHCFPDEAVIAERGRDLPHHATSGVFAGRIPPSPHLSGRQRAVAWTIWWADMLTVQLFVRVFVLVGDAPCHDYHHRRPASRRWTSYIQARQVEVARARDNGAADFSDTWGLFRAVDITLRSLASKPLGFRP
jgi:fatty acid desaturase